MDWLIMIGVVLALVFIFTGYKTTKNEDGSFMYADLLLISSGFLMLYIIAIVIFSLLF